MKKKLTKYGLFGTILVFLVLFGCKQDDFHNENTQQSTNEIVIKDISFDEFSKKLNKMKNKPNLERYMRSSENGGIQHARLEAGHGYVIYTDEIKEIRHGDYRSYTMYLQTPDTIKSNLYNFSIEEKGEETFLFVTKYRVANNWVEDSTLPFEGTISAYKVAIPNIEETSNLGAIELASWIDELEGLSGNGGSTTTTAYPYDCDGYVHTSIVVTEINCGCGHNWLEYMAGICIGSTCGLPIYPSKKTEYFYTCLHN